MLNTLASHNADIQKLIEQGYAVSMDNDYLVIRDIPYLDSEKKLQIGAIVSKLKAIDQLRVELEDHQVFFCGAHPCELNGNPIPNLGGGPAILTLKSEDLKVERSFSNKPVDGFVNNLEKIVSYVNIISGPAMHLYDVTPLTFRTSEEVSDSVFKFRDTLTTRAEIGDLALNVKDDIIAIIGLGGTGAYLLDFICKTPIKEIRGFDLDWFHVHNAFRSPGQLNEDELGKRKAEIYQKRYEGFRFGLNIQSKFILSDSKEDLNDVTFAFVCVDKGSSRSEIFALLMRLNIPFIDVGMGLARDKGPISGTLRTTYYPAEGAQEIFAQKLSPLVDIPDDIYKNNIQIAELNALNACMAIIKYKQIRGFYADDSYFYHMLFTLDNLKNAGESGHH